MNKKIIEAVVDEIDAVLSAPITARGVDEALLIDSETRSEIRKMVEKHLAEAPEPTSLVHQTRRR
jgi:hypothetical protein